MNNDLNDVNDNSNLKQTVTSIIHSQIKKLDQIISGVNIDRNAEQITHGKELSTLVSESYPIKISIGTHSPQIQADH